MSGDKKIAGKLSVGIFADGRYLRFVCLSRQKNKIKLIDAKSLVLNSPLESPGTDNGILTDSEIESSQEPIQIDINSEIQQIDVVNTTPTLPSMENTVMELAADDSVQQQKNVGSNAPKLNSPENTAVDIDFLETDIFSEGQDKASTESASPDFPAENETGDSFYTEQELAAQDNASILFDALSKFSGNKYKVAISLAEPQIYYTYFDADWGLDPKKLKQKIIDELSKERPDTDSIKPDTIHTLKLTNDNLLVIAREAEISLINLIEEINDSLGKRLPKISLVGTAEFSLVNLVKENYVFLENEITVILYIGYEFSRLIFMRGNELEHISPIIGEGTDSYGDSLAVLAHTLHSRLLLEQDDLNLPKINNIILTGEASRPEVKNVFSDSFDKKVNIEEIRFRNLDVEDVSSLELKELPQVAVALGSAWNSLDEANKDLYKVDLTPFEIKEGQKVFKLGIIGWILILLIPLLTFFITQRIGHQHNALNTIELQHRQKKAELAEAQKLQTRLDSARVKLAYYPDTFGVLDSMLAGTQTWSEFLKKIVREARNTPGIWITELATVNENTATLKGYSLYRNRIPRFSKAIGLSILKKVEVQEIRGTTVYSFEIEAIAPEQQPIMSEPVNEDSQSNNRQAAIEKSNAEIKVGARNINKKITNSATEIKESQPIQNKAASLKLDAKITRENFKKNYQNALQLFRNYKYEAAIIQFNALLKSQVKTKLKINCSYWIGESNFGLKKYTQAIEYFTEAASVKSTKTPAAIYMLGRSNQKLGNMEAAKKYFTKVITDYPESPFAIQAKASLEK